MGDKLRPAETTVHALQAGATLCGFMPGIAAVDWPEGHKWMSVSAYGCGPGFGVEAVRSLGGRACSVCVERLEQGEGS